MIVDFSTSGFIIIIIGIVLLILALIPFKRKRLIENVPTSKIRSIAMGLVEIYGEVVPEGGNILKSPFSQNDCVYYKYRIDELRQSGKNSHWVTIKKGLDYRNFYLKDETGMVLVDPHDANIDIPADNVFNSSLGKDPPYEVKQFLNNENIDFEGRLFGINKTMRFYEHFIGLKDKLYIMGTAADNPFVREASAVKGVEDIIIKKGENEKIFYISDKSENVLLKRLRIIVTSLFVFGILLIIFGIILFIL